MRAGRQIDELHLVLGFELGRLRRTDAAGKVNRLSEDSVEIDVRRAALRTLRKGIADRAGVAGRHTEIQIREVLCTTTRVIAEVAVTGVRIVN